MSRPRPAAFLLALNCVALPWVPPATASTPDAWSDSQRAVVQACVRASNLKNAQAGGNVIEFDDRAGVTAVVIAGRYPQRHMKNRPGRELCVYDKETRKAYVSEADSLLTPGR
ncbi:hypothetical protein GCM10007860_34370 [Chitiniphilus shinanonensis]|uniref:Uncharacterized protein n=1 Tax=Chitiniphilus shinanonensis TaxID=553088 RepID=A0ABQ6BX30_9NEIS|nr:hypothetical protein [Chitiniphilus shinanonensis]GLS06261.1 hypothetical protein GCM10007860_34370 [Chitiniphilus shinanonensis]